MAKAGGETWSTIYQRTGGTTDGPQTAPPSSNEITESSACRTNQEESDETQATHSPGRPESTTPEIKSSDTKEETPGGATAETSGDSYLQTILTAIHTPTLPEIKECRKSGHLWDWGCALPAHHFYFITNIIIPPSAVQPKMKQGSSNLPDIDGKTLNLSNYDRIDFDAQTVGIQLSPVIKRTKLPSDKPLISHPEKLSHILLVKLDQTIGQKPSEEVYMIDEATKLDNGYFKLLSGVCPKKYVDRKLVFSGLGMDYPVISKDGRCDILPAVSCPYWPPDAEKFNTRLRVSTWPCPALRHEVMSACLHIVPAAYNQGDVWRYDCQAATYVLLHSMSDMDKQLIILLKMLWVQTMQLPSYISVDHLLTVLFWTKESVTDDQWVPRQFLLCFTLVLQRLVIAIAQRHLPHYFISEVNLFADISPEHSTVVARGIVKARKSPLDVLVEYVKTWELLTVPHSADMIELIQPVLRDVHHAKSHDNEQYSVAHVLTPAAICLATIYVKASREADTSEGEKLMNLAGETLAMVQPMYQSAFPDRIYSCPGVFLRITCLEMTDYQTSTHLYEWSMQRWPNKETMASDISNLACIYHAWLASMPHGHQQQRLIIKTQQLFEESLQLDNFNSVDYCNFLVNMGKYKDAIPVLLRIANDREGNMMPRNTYGKSERATVDINLQTEIDAFDNTGIALIPPVYAYYMLIKCYQNLNQLDKANETILHLVTICADIPSNLNPYLRAMNLSLLGYAYKDLGDIESALVTFCSVQQTEKAYPTAAANIKSCESLLSTSEP